MIYSDPGEPRSPLSYFFEFVGIILGLAMIFFFIKVVAALWTTEPIEPEPTPTRATVVAPASPRSIEDSITGAGEIDLADWLSQYTEVEASVDNDPTGLYSALKFDRDGASVRIWQISSGLPIHMETAKFEITRSDRTYLTEVNYIDAGEDPTDAIIDPLLRMTFMLNQLEMLENFMNYGASEDGCPFAGYGVPHHEEIHTTITEPNKNISLEENLEHFD